MFTTQATIERRAAKEARLQAIESRLEETEHIEEKLITLESRLDVLEKKEIHVPDITPVTQTLTDLSGSFASLQQKYTDLEKLVQTMQEEIVELRKQQQQTTKTAKQTPMFPIAQKKATEESTSK